MVPAVNRIGGAPEWSGQVLGRSGQVSLCLLLPPGASFALEMYELDQRFARLVRFCASSCGFAGPLLDVGGGGAHRYAIGSQPIEVVGGGFDHGRAQQADALAPAKGAIGVAHRLIPVMTSWSGIGAARWQSDGFAVSWQ